jgi:hypothetical protein
LVFDLSLRQVQRYAHVQGHKQRLILIGRVGLAQARPTKGALAARVIYTRKAKLKLNKNTIAKATEAEGEFARSSETSNKGHVPASAKRVRGAKQVIRSKTNQVQMF